MQLSPCARAYRGRRLFCVFLFWGCSLCCALFCGWLVLVRPGWLARVSAVAVAGVCCLFCSAWSGLCCSLLCCCLPVVGRVFCVRFSGLCRVLFLRGVLVSLLLCVVGGVFGFRCGGRRWCVVGRWVFAVGGAEVVWWVGWGVNLYVK